MKPAPDADDYAGLPAVPEQPVPTISRQSKRAAEGEAVGVDTQKGAARVREKEEKPCHRAF